MGKNVTLIPAKNNKNSYKDIEKPKKKVAAYCRVSTEFEEQLNSYNAQVKYYKTYIRSHPDYEFAGVYADAGISGRSTKNREEFMKMIESCKNGKIDYIITKSISRFTRNTLDCLNYVRMLKDLGVGIIFEKENINSLDNKGEVLLTILSSLAQDESRSISENCTWGIRRKFEQGKIRVNYRKFVGYGQDAKGNLIIDENQAKIIKRIYHEFLNGKGSVRIAKELERDNIPNWNGKAVWYEKNILSILKNEKYKGDSILQKSYTVDFLSRKRAKNNGVLPKYYVEDSHPAIIDKELWDVAQLEFERRKAFKKKYNMRIYDIYKKNNCFISRVICGKCNRIYGRKVWNSKDPKLRRVIWQCNKKYETKGVVGCNNRHVDGFILPAVFINAYNSIVENIYVYRKRWNKLLEGNDYWLKYTAKKFIDVFDNPVKIDEFDEELFLKLVERIVIYKLYIKVYFLDGSEIKV
jgi:DNA invertase Pin-like site-specific DNA recombinase